MKQFSIKLKPENSNNFHAEYMNIITMSLRETITNTILSRKDETEYIFLDTFSNNWHITHTDLLPIVKNLMLELNILGWTCNLSYGNTALFIYADKDKPPSNYYPDFF